MNPKCKAFFILYVRLHSSAIAYHITLFKQSFVFAILVSFTKQRGFNIPNPLKLICYVVEVIFKVSNRMLTSKFVIAYSFRINNF